jgi:hypothetical protein
MMAIIALLAIALTLKFRPQQAHRVVEARVEYGTQYQWVPMLNGWFEIRKHGKGTQFKSAPASVGRPRFKQYWPLLNLAVIAGWVIFAAIVQPPGLRMVGLPLASYVWNQTSGILASTAVNWNRPAQTVETAVTTDNNTGHDLSRGAARQQVRTSGGRLLRVAFQQSTNDLVIDYTDDATPNEWTTTTRVVVDSSRNYDRMSMAIDSADNIYIFAGDPGVNGIVLFRSTDDGATWSSTLDSGNQLNDTNYNVNDVTCPTIRIDGADFLHFAWKEATTGDIRYCVSDAASPDPAVFQLTGNLRVTHGSVTGGPFQVGEVVNFAPSGASGTVARVNVGSLDFQSISGTPAGGDTLTGAGSGATAAFTAQVDIPDDWDIETYKGGTGGSSEAIDAGDAFSFSNSNFGNIYDMELTDEGAGVYGVMFVWDNNGTGTTDRIFFRKKDDNQAWSAAAARIVASDIGTTSYGNPSLCSNNDDSLIVCAYIGTGSNNYPRFTVSTNGGTSFGSPVQTLVSDIGMSMATMGFDGGYFWFTQGTGGGNSRFQQFFIDSAGVATRVQDLAISTAATEDIPGLRWQRFTMTDPEKMDIAWSEASGSSDGWWMLPDRAAPHRADSVTYNATSTTNCDYDLTVEIVSYTQDTGYSGQVDCSQSLDVVGAITHNAGTLNMDNGMTCDTFSTLFNSFTTTRARGACNVATSVTVSGNTTFDLSASTGNATLTCPTVISLGTFRCRDNTVNSTILQGPDNSTYLEFVSGFPDLDFSGTTALAIFGTAATNRGVLLNVATFSIGTGSLTIRNQSEFDTLNLNTSDLAILSTTRVVINKNWDSSTANSFTSNNSTVAFTGAVDGAYTITTDGTAGQAFYIVEWAENATTATVSGDVYIGFYIDFQGTGNIAGTQDVILTSLTQNLPWRNTTSSNSMASWSGEVQYDFSGAAVDTFIQGYYPTLRVLSNGPNNFDISGTLDAEDDIIFGDGASLANIRHNSGIIDCVNLTIRDDSDFTHVTAANLQIICSGAMTVVGRFFAESTTNSYNITATNIVVTSLSATDGVFRFTDVNNNGSAINLGGTAASGLVAGADTEIVIKGQSFANLLLFTGFITCTTPDTFEIEFVHIDTNDVTSTAVTMNGDNSAATSFFLRDCDIDSPFLGWAFGGVAWTNTSVSQFIRNDVEIGVRITNDSKIGMTNSVVPDAGMDTANGSLIVFGTVRGGDLIADIFGDFDAPADVLATQSLETGQRNVVNIREPVIAGSTLVTVTANQNVNSWIMSAASASVVINGTFTLTTNLTSTLSTLTALGIYHHNNNGALNIIGTSSVVLADSGGTFRISTLCLVTMDDTTILRVNNDSFIDLTGTGRATRVNFVRNITAGNEPYVHIQNAAAAGGINMNFVSFTDYGAGNVAAVHVDQNCGGVFDDIQFTNCNVGLDLSGATGSGAGQPGIQCTTMAFTNCPTGISMTPASAPNTKNRIEDVIIEGSSIGIALAGFLWDGIMRNVSSINNTSYGLQATGSAAVVNPIPPGAINHCVFHGDIADINILAGATTDPYINLTNCILSDKAVSSQVSPGGTAWQVISYNHNRVNTKEVIVYNDLVIDSSTVTPIHLDKFDWSEFNIAADGASYIVPTPASTPLSELIPVEASKSYYIAYTGTLATFDIIETITGGGSSTTATGLSSGAIHATGVFAAYLQISWGGAAAGETLTHLEIREDTSGGDLIYNDDLINKFKSPNSGWEYSTSFGLAGTSGVPAILPFGDFGYEFIEMLVDVPVVPSGDRAGVVLGWQNNSNYYEVYLDGTNNDLRINKVVSGSPTLIDRASDFNGSTVINPNAVAYTMRITWNKAANNAIQVFLDAGTGETVVAAAGWVTEATNDYVTDAQFDVGNIGLISEDVILDNLAVNHDGFYIREAALTLATGISITVQSGGVFDTNEVTVNASESVLNVLAGGTNNQTATTWLDQDLDENVLGPQTLECGTYLVTADMVWGVGGEADWTGVTIQRTPETSTFRILTESSLALVPIKARGISLPNVQPSIRPLDGSEGRYDLDPTLPSPSEFILPSPDPGHRREVLEDPVWGLDRARVTPWTMDSKRLTLRMMSKRDKCLWGKCEKWKDNATPLEVISYRGIIYGVIIVDVRAARIRNNKSVHEWDVDFIEAR